MTDKTHDIIDKIKAAAFPAVIALLIFFLSKYYSQQGDMLKEVQDVHEETIKINGIINTQEFRLDQKDQIDNQQNRRLDGYEKSIQSSSRDKRLYFRTQPEEN